MRIPRRFLYLAQWLGAAATGRDRPTTLGEMLRFAGSPPYRERGRRHVARVDREGTFLVLRFRDFPHPLFWPAEYPLDDLYMVASEQFDPDDWHRYEVAGTTVERGDIVVDCGAAEGLFALSVADRCRKVCAVEPVPRWVEAMHRTFANLPNVRIIDALVGDVEGVGHIGGSGLTAAAASAGTEVRMTTLDALFPAGGEDPTYLKADVEGAELELLRGGAEWIRRAAPKIAITTYHKPEHAREIEALLRELQPRYRFLTKGYSQFGTPLLLHAWV